MTKGIELVKLVDSNWRTHNRQQWTIGQTVSLPVGRRGNQLCSGQVLHAYHNVAQALLMNPVHTVMDLSTAHLLQATSPFVAADDGTKVGVHALTPTKELALPEWWTTPDTRRRVQVQFAVLCAQEVLAVFEDKYPKDTQPRRAIETAAAYLNGQGTADTAAAAARAAARAAAYAADAAYAYAAAAYAAYAAAYAAAAAAYAAYAAAAAARTASYAAYALTAAADAARTASYATRAAADGTIDTALLANRAVDLQAAAAHK